MNAADDSDGEKGKRELARVGFTPLLLAFLLILFLPSRLAGWPHGERIVANRTIDRRTIERLQGWVSSGHESWCEDPRMVATKQLRRIAPDFSGEQKNLIVLPPRIRSASATKIVFQWTPLDRRATFRVTVERFSWLLPIARRHGSIVWVPTRTEILAHE